MRSDFPKVFNIIWIGPPIPKLQQRCVESWRTHHKDWEVKVWNEDMIKAEKLQNAHLLPKCNSYAQVSDVVRYELMYRYGGIALGADMECLKNVEALIGDAEFVTSNETDDYSKYMSCGFFCALPEHVILKRAVDQMPEVNFGKSANISTGPYYFRKAIADDINRIEILPAKYIYPLTDSRTTGLSAGIVRKLHPEAYCFHHWSGSWLV